MSFSKGSLVLIPYPFSDLSSNKKRPVLVLTKPDKLGDFCALPVTTKPYHSNSILLNDFLDSGNLPKTSWVRTDRIVTLNKTLVIKEFASCSMELIRQVIQDLCNFVQS